jgi:hypothetical protein
MRTVNVITIKHRLSTNFWRKIRLSALFIFLSTLTFGQSKLDSLLGKLDPQKLAASIEKKAKKFEDKIVNKSLKALDQLQSQEEKLYKKMLSGPDSLNAKVQLNSLNEKYAGLRSIIKNPVAHEAKNYIPHLDSLTTSLKLLDQNGVGGKIKDALAISQSLQDKFNGAEQIRRFIKERIELLKQQLEELGVVKQLKQFNKKAYYYAQQINQYKEILKDPKKIEKKALELLSKTKWFQDFFKKNSMLASLFRTPGDPNDAGYLASLAGLQTRNQLNNIIQERIASAGANGRQFLQQNIQAAQNQLQALKAKALKFGAGSSDAIMPEGFKPNSQKTKSFLRRLEYGMNFQSQKSSTYFPVTSDFGLSVGFKLNDRSIIGIGGSYKVGLGRGWNDIRFSSEGVSLRSFVDWKIKGNFWISGGYERNFKSGISNISRLRDNRQWQESGLIGLSKSLSVKTKFFKKTKLMFLWDFLSKKQRPISQPIIFRIGYNF